MYKWLNYNHLFYFWVIAQEGSITAAAKKLRLSQPTLSTQLKALELSMSSALFDRAGRTLELTAEGQSVFEYADAMFAVGERLKQSIESRKRRTAQPQFRVGVDEFISMTSVRHIFQLKKSSNSTDCCHQYTVGTSASLYELLENQRLDVVLSYTPCSAALGIRSHSRVFCGGRLGFFGSHSLCTRYRKGKGGLSLAHAPFVLPSAQTYLRDLIDKWFDEKNVTPNVIAEGNTMSLLEQCGHDGIGFFPSAERSISENSLFRDLDSGIMCDGVLIKLYLTSLYCHSTLPGGVLIPDSAAAA